MASFVVILESGQQKLVTCQGILLRLGRLVDSEIFVDDPTVSRRHAEITCIDGNYFLSDMGSSNGTLVNGRLITGPTELSPGDNIVVGNAKIIFEPPKPVSLFKEKEVPEPEYLLSLGSMPPIGQATAPRFFLETVAEVARQIVQDKPLEQLLDSILQVCLDRTGAECAAIIRIDEKGDLVPLAYLSKSNTSGIFAVSRSIAWKAIKENKAILVRDFAGDDNLLASESVLGLKIRTAICTPLWNGEKAVGVMYVDSTAVGHQFGENELLFFSTLSGMIAERMENSTLAGLARYKHRLDAELGIACDIQAHLFPSAIPVIEGFGLSAFNRPSTEVGGDYFDIIESFESWEIVIADVMGKGIGAAILMSNLQAMVRTLSSQCLDPATILARINSDLVTRVGDGMFITCCHLILKPQDGTIIYANAGHNKPLLYRHSGEVSSLNVSGIPLGILAGESYETYSDRLNAGDVLLLYTDGITECVDGEGEYFGEERLKLLLAESAELDAEGIKKVIRSEVDKFRKDTPCSDDMTFVVLKREAIHVC